MRRAALVLVAGIVGLAPGSALAAFSIGPTSIIRVGVSPRTGTAHTRFRFTLRLPAATGGRPGWRNTDTLSVVGPRRTGCDSAGFASLPAAQAGATVSVMLRPSARTPRWCRGTFHGEVIETMRTICSPPPTQIMCPMIEVAPRVIARFSFRVTRTA
ncbi:MAG: hypothetical protein ACRDMX_00930 [Solirubrobacteraceae bacterium]